MTLTNNDAVVEAVAKSIRDTWYPEGHVLGHMAWPGGEEFWLSSGRAALSAAIPLIEKQVIERCAQVAEDHYALHPATTVRVVNYRHAGRQIAKAIRSLGGGV